MVIMEFLKGKKTDLENIQFRNTARRPFQRFRALRGKAEGRVPPREDRARHGDLIERLARVRGGQQRSSDRVHAGMERGCREGGRDAFQRVKADTGG